MKPKEFKEMNCVFAKNQADYLPLPAHRSEEGVVTSSWGLSLRERVRVLFTGKVFVRMLTFNKPVQPIRVYGYSPFADKEK